MTRYAAIIVALLSLLWPGIARANPGETALHVNIPYTLAADGSGTQGGSSLKALIWAENTGPAERSVRITVTGPPELIPLDIPEGWEAGRGVIAGDIRLPGGYGQWFDLLTFDAARLAAGEYEVAISLDDGDRRETIRRKVALGRKEPGTARGLTITNVTLPVDRLGNLDERMDRNTLVLRDKALDYYKSVLKGRGAYNDAAEAVHPLAYVNIEFANPAGEEKLLVVTSQLFGRDGEAAPGLFTPAASVDDREDGGFPAGKDGTNAFLALDGAARQTVRLPLYIDEDVLPGGRYILRITAREDDRQVAAAEVPVTVLARDSRAAAVTLGGLVLVACGMIAALYRRQAILEAMKTRWLITITLFGAASFAVVNVPSTLLSDMVHVVLGPLAFLVTGMFHGILLYMLIAALVVLVPRPGAVALLLAVRFLLGVVAFGQASPVAMLFCGTQAVLLEAFFYLAGITVSRERGFGGDGPPILKTGWRGGLLLAMACAAADGICTYLNLNALAFLYRFFYADWYIAAVVAVNGVVYSGVGGYCGALLGDKLKAVGSD